MGQQHPIPDSNSEDLESGVGPRIIVTPPRPDDVEVPVSSVPVASLCIPVHAAGTPSEGMSSSHGLVAPTVDVIEPPLSLGDVEVCAVTSPLSGQEPAKRSTTIRSEESSQREMDCQPSEDEKSLMGDVQKQILMITGLKSGANSNSVSATRSGKNGIDNTPMQPTPSNGLGAPTPSSRPTPKNVRWNSKKTITDPSSGDWSPESEPSFHFVGVKSLSSIVRGPCRRRLRKCWRSMCYPFQGGLRFRTAVILVVTLSVVLACIGMSIPLEVFLNWLRTQTLATYNETAHKQTTMIEQLTKTSAHWAHTNTLRTTASHLESVVLEPADRAVDILWGAMRTYRAMDDTWQGTSSQDRTALARRSLIELTDQFSSKTVDGAVSSRAEYLYVGYPSGEFAGASIQMTGDSSDSDQDQRVYDASDGVLTTWNATCESFYGCQLSKDRFVTSSRPWYVMQEHLAIESYLVRYSKPVQRAWSQVYYFTDRNIGLTRTAPLAYCGNYSCFEGVVAADITLAAIEDGCVSAWGKFVDILADSNFHFPIGHSNSSVFIVNQVTRHEDEEGLLLGSSHRDQTATNSKTLATESHQSIVAITARAVLKRFGSWGIENLTGSEQFFSFRNHSVEEDQLDYCDSTATGAAIEDCLTVGTLSVALDDDSRWLVVLVSPAHAFTQNAFEITREVERDLEALPQTIDSMVLTVRHIGYAVTGFVTLLSLVIGFGLSVTVSAPLRRLSKLMRKLGQLDLDFCKNSADALALQEGKRAHIADISELEDAYAKLSLGLEVFARFVPETVVRNIVQGDERATRLHVSRRNVTIMFSDIRDFTSISEQLRHKDLLFLLTHYLTTMTRIVQDYGGVVAEILGDGLLVFWNTPDDTPDHAGKACQAALAMQEALTAINADIARLNVTIAVRIGLHTGQVLSGNIGSQTKMKFGCIGDPVNLASRLEGLCKVYSVGVMCSSATYDALPPGSDFICRKLDTVQVKGKSEPTLVYEVMGQGEDSYDDTEESPFWRAASLGCRSPSEVIHDAVVHSTQSLELSGMSPSQHDGFPKVGILAHISKSASAHRRVISGMRARGRSYEQALEHFQAGQFAMAHDSLEALLKDHPDDGAAIKLLERAQECVALAGGNDCDARPASNTLGVLPGVRVMLDK